MKKKRTENLRKKKGNFQTSETLKTSPLQLLENKEQSRMSVNHIGQRIIECVVKIKKKIRLFQRQIFKKFYKASKKKIYTCTYMYVYKL